MKLSVFTTITNPNERGDNWADAMACYKELADEVVVVDGGGIANNSTDLRYLHQPWPEEFDWPLIGRQFQRGYEAATGDWVIHADVDFLFHERDFWRIRQALQSHANAPAVSFWKYQFILPDRYNLKSRLVIAVNKKAFGDRIRFDSGGDLCQPSLDGKELKPEDVPEARVPFYNYEKITKTKEQIMDDAGRMARAWDRYFHDKKLGYDDAEAFGEWLHMVKGRFVRPSEHIKLHEHPKYIRDTIKSLRENQWGYSGFGQLGKNNYIEEFDNA